MVAFYSVSEFGSVFASMAPLAVSFCKLQSRVRLPFVLLSILILIPKPFLFFPNLIVCCLFLNIFKSDCGAWWSFKGSWSAFPGREKEVTTRERAEIAAEKGTVTVLSPTGCEEKGCWLHILQRTWVPPFPHIIRCLSAISPASVFQEQEAISGSALLPSLSTLVSSTPLQYGEPYFRNKPFPQAQLLFIPYFFLPSDAVIKIVYSNWHTCFLLCLLHTR